MDKLMYSIIFASNNQHKVNEIREALPPAFEIITLKEAGINIDIPEPHDTLEANASEKSSFIFNLTGKNCFSEDTGLEVNSLNGEPGVLSARYAAPTADPAANIEKLLKNLEGKKDRQAQFKTIISYFTGNGEHLFEGICKGMITHSLQGSSGFGYDPVFIPEGATKTFAEMTIEEKNKFSHRKKALIKFLDFLNNNKPIS